MLKFYSPILLSLCGCIYRRKAKQKQYGEEKKRKDWQNFLAKLKALPPERLSKAAKWVLENEEKGGSVHYDMKAVMK